MAAASAMGKGRSSMGGDVDDVNGADIADAPAEGSVAGDAIGDGKVEDDANG